jgi:hypothetical protein
MPDLAQILSIGGPTSIVTVLLTFVSKAWLDNRRERREDDKQAVATESGIIDNTKRVMELVRAETDRLERKNLELESKLAEEQEQVRQCADEASRQRRRADRLEEELGILRQRVTLLEGRLAKNGESQA